MSNSIHVCYTEITAISRLHRAMDGVSIAIAITLSIIIPKLAILLRKITRLEVKVHEVQEDIRRVERRVERLEYVLILRGVREGFEKREDNEKLQ